MDQMSIKLNQINYIPWYFGAISNIDINPSMASNGGVLYRYGIIRPKLGDPGHGYTLFFSSFGPNDWTELHFADSPRVRVQFDGDGVLCGEFISLR